MSKPLHVTMSSRASHPTSYAAMHLFGFIEDSADRNLLYNKCMQDCVSDLRLGASELVDAFLTCTLW